MTPDDLPPRIAAKIQVADNGCWHWTASLNAERYGRVRWDGKAQKAHRVVYALLMGGLSADLVIDHRCHSEDPTCMSAAECMHRRCVNPQHMREVTMAENNAWTVKTRSNHCPRGHEYAGANLYLHPSNGARICKTCRDERLADYIAANRDKINARRRTRRQQVTA